MNLGRRTSLSNPGLSLDTRIWPRENIKERNTHEPLMIHSWTTHEGGPWDIDSFIHVFIHSVWRKDSLGFLGFRWIPLDSLGEHISMWGEEHLYPIRAFLWHQSLATEKAKERKTYEPLMTHSWTTHKGVALHPDSFIHSFSHFFIHVFIHQFILYEPQRFVFDSWDS